MKEKIGVAGLKPTRFENPKGTRIGPSLFYTSELHAKLSIANLRNNFLKKFEIRTERSTNKEPPQLRGFIY